MALRTPLSVTPHLYMGDSTGRPLDKGVVYFGQQDKDPEFYPINLFSDDALTLPLAQPVHTKGGYLYDKGDMVEPHAKEIVYSVKVLDSYGRKVFYKGAMMRNSWNDDVIEQINAAIVASTDIARQVATDITNDAINNAAVEGGVLADTFVTMTKKGEGTVARNLRDINSDTYSVTDFGAIKGGVHDSTDAFQNAIDYAATIVATTASGVNTVTALVEIPAGNYRLTRPLILRNGVQIKGSGSGNVLLLVNHTGDGITTPEGTDYYANIHLSGFKLSNNGTGTTNAGIVQERTIRNCYMFDVIVEKFYDNYYFADTWTHKINQCFGFNAGRYNIHAAQGTGGLHIYGGRYDVAESHSIYVDAIAAELIMNDVTAQYTKGSGVYVKNHYTVELHQCFFEGNCIGSSTDYHVYINNDEQRTLSSSSVINCVINNLNQSERDGLGILYVNNSRVFTYKERWTRNGVSQIPIVGDGVLTSEISLNTSNSREPAVANVKAGTSVNAVVRQLARPYGIYGRDMAELSSAPTIYAAANIGTLTSGVAIGTVNYKGALQGYGTDFSLALNAQRGDLLFGQSGSCSILAGTNEFYGRIRDITQAATSNLTPASTTGFVAIDATSGARTVALTNFKSDYGRRLVVAKTDNSANTVIISPKAGETINGASSYTITGMGAVSLIGINGGWLTI